jgi:DNA-binding NtrC family response regulator
VFKLRDVLVVDDDADHACMIARELRTRHHVRIAIGLRDAVHELTRKVPEVIICAFDMPPYRGDALLAMIAREHPEVRRILFDRRPTDAAALLAAIGDE